MSEESDKKRYYWIKLQRDFFKRSEFKVLESLPNGKDYIIFYLKLLLESADKLGELRFSDTIPYNDNMLAALTDTHPTVVREALKFFEDMRLIEIMDDETIFMTELSKMVGSETAAAIRQRKHRESLKARCDNVAIMSQSETLQSNEEYRVKSIELRDKSIESIELEKEKGISTGVDIPKEKDELSLIPAPESKPKKERKRFIPPTVEEVAAYCRERGNNIDAEAFVAHYSARNWIPKGYTKQMTNWKAAVITWEKYDQKRAQEQKPKQSTSMSAFDQFRQQEGLGPATSIFGG